MSVIISKAGERKKNERKNFEIKKRLRRTAKDLGYPHNLQGWGLFEVKSFLNENNG